MKGGGGGGGVSFYLEEEEGRWVIPLISGLDTIF